MKRTLYTPLLIALLTGACAPAVEPSPPVSQDAPPAISEPETPEPENEAPEDEASTVSPTAPMTGGADVEAPEDETGAEATPPDAMTGGAGADAAPPEGTLQISADNQTFVNGEENPVTVRAGESFYVRLAFSDPSGVQSVEVQLRNSQFAGTLPTGPFTVDAEASTCEAQLAEAPTELNCVLKVDVAPDAQPINQEGEFAYAFRPSVTDAAGNSDLAYVWGYLIVEPQ